MIGKPSSARAPRCPSDRLEEVARRITPDSDGLLIFSSGTTAKPKGVQHRPPRAEPSVLGAEQGLRAHPADPDVDRAADVLDRRDQLGDGRDARGRRLLGACRRGSTRGRRWRCSPANGSPSPTPSPIRPGRWRSIRIGRPPTCRRCGRCTASRCSRVIPPCTAIRAGRCPWAGGCRRRAPSSPPTPAMPDARRAGAAWARSCPGPR